MKKVLVAGELNVDIVLQGYHAFPEAGKEVLVDDFVMVLGSASAICAMGLAKLGGRVAFVGRAGADPCSRLAATERPVLVLFGTGWGLSPALIDDADVRIEPIRARGETGYNHLSVRAACAITLDRLLG
jgi:hypothetical protein